MRKFKIINSLGIEYDLCDESHSFESPAGLGFDRDMEFTQAGNNFIETKDDPVQKAPSGEMVFTGYEEYAEFAKFIAYTPLILCYSPLEVWYYLDCKVKSFKKGEISSGALYCDIDFTAYGMWYLPTVVNKTVADGSLGKKYSYAYPYTYIDNTRGTIKITNDSTIDAPCKLHILGPCTNPKWNLIQDSEIVSTGKVTVTVTSNQKLVIDSNTLTMEIALRGLDNTLVEDEYQNSDFSTERFIYAPPGESILSFTHDGTETINAIAEVKQLADTV